MGSKSSRPGWLKGKGALAAIILVIIVIVSSVGAYVLLDDDDIIFDGGRSVKTGDLVRVNYIGMLPNGQVFDTSLYSVAIDNVTYPKSLFFGFRGDQSKYSTLNFTVGQGQMIDGFETGVLGMKVGETRTIVIPVEDAYGPANESKITTMNLTESVPMYKEMSVDDFEAYFGETPTSNKLYTDPNHGWQVWTTNVDKKTVRMQNMATDGATYRAHASPTDPSYGWNITVNIDNTNQMIIVHHDLDSSSAMAVKGMDGVSGRLYVKSVDEAAGTAVIDRNNQILGQDLTFTITLVSIG